jgi:hypothetical protein
MKKVIIFIVTLCAYFSYAQQNLDEWTKKQKTGFETFKKSEQQKFQKFKDERDSAFVEFLKKEWQAFEVFKGMVPEKVPKPVEPPVTEPKEIPEEVEETSIRIEEIHLPQPPMEKAAESIEYFISKIIKEKESLDFSFYRVNLKVNYDPWLKDIKLADPVNEKSIGDFWADLSCSEYEDLLEQTLKIKDQMKLNDWGYGLLVHQIANKIYPDSEKRQKLWDWFVLSKSGYEAKVGYHQDAIYLLLPSMNPIYNVPYFEIDDKKYFVINFDQPVKLADSVYTYQSKYLDQPIDIALHMKESPLVGDSLSVKTLQFEYDKEVYPVSLDLKTDIIDFYSQYPQTDYTVYFDAPLSAETKYSLLRELKTVVEGKSEVEAVNLLLRFVQTAFGYKKDDLQFGYEKPFFTEETLFYPYSDCEDRSVLFAYLVRNLLNLDVIGLDYPGHIATAVKFSTEIEGDYVNYQGVKYLICDATYVNANIGQCMPRFKNVKSKVISIGGH